MQNKPNSKPIQTQYKPNSLDAQMNVSSVITKYYENNICSGLLENKPNSKPIKANQTQNKPNMNPKQTQYKPNLVRRLVRRSPLINPCGTETEALAKADSKRAPIWLFFRRGVWHI